METKTETTTVEQREEPSSYQKDQGHLKTETVKETKTETATVEQLEEPSS